MADAASELPIQARTAPAALQIDRAQVAARSRGYWATVLSRLRRDKVTLACAAVLLAIVLSAIFAPLLAPADPYATSMLKRLKPIGTPGYPLGTDELGRDMLTRLLFGGRLSLLMGLTPVFIYATSLISVSIILASGLSFLGLGTEPPHPEWGLMLNTLRQSIYINPYVAALPGAMIFMTSLSFNLLSDGLRSAMDVRW
jgi:ABC-type dipeptide/oligopeptide/nickel transport system permease subunit